MNALTIQKKLETMKNKTFEYAGSTHTVQSYIVSETEKTFEIKTNLDKFKRKFESGDKFFLTWYEKAENRAIQKVQDTTAQSDVMPVFEKENTLADQLVEILMDNIKKVKNNQAYIPQAKAINNDVNSILHVQRLKLDMVKHIKNKK